MKTTKTAPKKDNYAMGVYYPDNVLTTSKNYDKFRIGMGKILSTKSVDQWGRPL